MKGENRQQTEGLNRITGEQWISYVPGAMVLQGAEETRILNILKIKKKITFQSLKKNLWISTSKLSRVRCRAFSDLEKLQGEWEGLGTI